MPITNKKDKKFMNFFEKPYKILTKDAEITALTAIIMYFKLKLVAKRNNIDFSENLEYEKLEFNLDEKSMDKFISMLIITEQIIPV